jgi:hypothetical protein
MEQKEWEDYVIFCWGRKGWENSIHCMAVALRKVD